MDYLQKITSNGTWTCPKTGIWEIICVGGGAAGGPASTAEDYVDNRGGGSTKFGTVLTAAGGSKAANLAYAYGYNVCVGSFGGYSEYDYGSAPGIIVQANNANATVTSGSGLNMQMGYSSMINNTYGSTGVCRVTGNTTKSGGSNKSGWANIGGPGGLAIKRICIAQGQSFACTIGAGGTAAPTFQSSSDAPYVTYNQTNGSPGVIVLRYLGPSGSDAPGTVYYEEITSARNWVCPKSGIWKVTAVGGGASGYSSTPLSSRIGGVTSFGSKLTAAGGGGFYSSIRNQSLRPYNTSTGGTPTEAYETLSCIGGHGGWTAFKAGGAPGIISCGQSSEPTGNGTYFGTGLGYGASGGCRGYGSYNYPYSGAPGKIETGIFDISKDEVFTCTIGAAGVVTVNADGYAGCTGKAGAIIVEYIGESAA